MRSSAPHDTASTEEARPRPRRRPAPSWWSQDVESFLAARLREPPHITTQSLLDELSATFAIVPAPPLDTFRHALSGHIYTRFDDIAEVRRAGQVRSGNRAANGSRVPLLLALLKEAEDSGRYAIEIEPFLRQREKDLLRRLREPPSPVPPADASLEQAARRGYQQVFLLLRKFTRWKEGGPFFALKQPRRDLRAMLQSLVQAATARGATVEQAFAQAKLNPTEREAVARYALAPEPATGPAVARALGRKSITVMVSLTTAINKLEGREGRYHLKTKYFRMHDEELAERIRSDGFSSRRDLVRSDRALYEVALARGILDDIFPFFERQSLRKLRAALAERLKSSTLEELTAGMTPFHVGILKHRALAKAPQGLRFFQRAYGIEHVYEIAAAEHRLRRQLRSLPYHSQPRDRLRQLLLRMPEGERAAVLSALDPREAELAHLRALSDDPARLSDLGARWGVSRERVRQIEERLCERLAAPGQGPSYREARRGQRAGKESRPRLGNDGNLGELRTLAARLSPRGLGMVSEDLRKTERLALERRALAEVPATIDQLAEERGITAGSVRLAENRLLAHQCAPGHRGGATAHRRGTRGRRHGDGRGGRLPALAADPIARPLAAGGGPATAAARGAQDRTSPARAPRADRRAHAARRDGRVVRPPVADPRRGRTAPAPASALLLRPRGRSSLRPRPRRPFGEAARPTPAPPAAQLVAPRTSAQGPMRPRSPDERTLADRRARARPPRLRRWVSSEQPDEAAAGETAPSRMPRRRQTRHRRDPWLTGTRPAFLVSSLASGQGLFRIELWEPTASLRNRIDGRGRGR